MEANAANSISTTRTTQLAIVFSLNRASVLIYGSCTHLCIIIVPPNRTIVGPAMEMFM